MSLEKQLLAYLQQHCQKDKECIIDLHNALSFEWDRAYFFYKYNKKNIQRIVESDYNFDTDLGTQIIFMKSNQVVAYQELPLPMTDFAFVKDIPTTRIDIEFMINAKNINDVTYTNYYALDQIQYYSISPNNDKLKILQNTIQTGKIFQKVYTLYPMSLTQVIMK